MSLPAAEFTSVEFMFIVGRAVFLLFSFVLAAYTFTAWRRATQLQTEKVLSQTNTVLQRLAALEARVDATKVTISQLGDRLERPAAVANTNPAAANYQMATRLAKGGASREELMAGCGLSLAEAELVQRLHDSVTERLARESPARARQASVS
jgi:membrane protein required for beta-lactamase induction